MKPYKYCCYYDNCEKIYKTKFNLRRHINSYHLHIRSHTCARCNKSFVSKQNMKEHEFSHTGEKPFKCHEPGCSRRFRQSSQLSIHKRSHRPISATNILKGCVIHMRLTDFWHDSTEPPEFQPIIHIEKINLPAIRPGVSLGFTCSKLPVLPLLLEHLRDVS